MPSAWSRPRSRLALAIIVACGFAGGCDVDAPPSTGSVPPSTSTASGTPVERREVPESSGLSERQKRFAQMVVAGSGWPTLHPGGMRVGNVGRFAATGLVKQVAPALLVESQGVDFIIEGTDSSDLVDGRSLNLSSFVFEVVRTRSYVTVIGAARTVNVVRPLSNDELDGISKEVGRLSAIAFTKAAEEQDRKDYRPWQLVDGTLTERAKLINFDGRVSLQTKSGETVILRLDELAESERHEVRKAKDFLPKPAPKANWDKLQRSLDQKSENVTKTKEHPARQWSSVDGRFSTEASYLYSSGDFVWLKKSDGETVKVSRDVLSEADQSFIRELTSARE